MLLEDRVAQAARRMRCHYVDLAGLSVVKERLLSYNREITDLGLSFVISAGWMPGLTELLPVYAFTRAKAKMDAIESLNVYFSDSGEWSTNALRDGLWYLRWVGLSAALFPQGSLGPRKSVASLPQRRRGRPHRAASLYDVDVNRTDRSRPPAYAL